MRFNLINPRLVRGVAAAGIAITAIGFSDPGASALAASGGLMPASPLLAQAGGCFFFLLGSACDSSAKQVLSQSKTQPAGGPKEAPEPFTILGSMAAVGFGAFFSKEYRRKQAEGAQED